MEQVRIATIATYRQARQALDFVLRAALGRTRFRIFTSWVCHDTLR